jgi:hypothetical protein
VIAAYRGTRADRGFVQHARCASLALPGRSSKDDPAVNYSHLARILGRPHGPASWKPAWKQIIEESVGGRPDRLRIMMH